MVFQTTNSNAEPTNWANRNQRNARLFLTREQALANVLHSLNAISLVAGERAADGSIPPEVAAQIIADHSDIAARMEQIRLEALAIEADSLPELCSRLSDGCVLVRATKDTCNKRGTHHCEVPVIAPSASAADIDRLVPAIRWWGGREVAANVRRDQGRQYAALLLAAMDSGLVLYDRNNQSDGKPVAVGIAAGRTVFEKVPSRAENTAIFLGRLRTFL